MHRASQLVSQDLVDKPLPLKAAEIAEFGARDADAEMRFPSFGRTGMAGVLGRFINDFQHRRRKLAFQLAAGSAQQHS